MPYVSLRYSKKLLESEDIEERNVLNDENHFPVAKLIEVCN